MRIYIGLLAFSFLCTWLAILAGDMPAQPLFWAAMATASVAPVVRRSPERGGVMLLAICGAEVVMGLTVQVTLFLR